MSFLHEDLSHNLISTPPSIYSSSSSILTDDCSTNTLYTLRQILSNPKLLNAFECFLKQTWSHENLLFIEAVTQLKHEEDPKSVEITLHRIYKTFLASGSPLELNVTTQKQVKDDIRLFQWAIVSRADALNILEETKVQVLDMLKAKLTEFTQTMELQTENVCPTEPQKQQVRVVIIGGGFTGFTVASILDQMPRFYVTLIDTKDSFEYTPGIVKKIVKPDTISSLRVRHDSYVKNGRVIIGYAEKLSNKCKTITVEDEKIDFDYLVVATGSAYSSQLKSSDTSSIYRISGLEESYSELLKAQKVLIIGGGLVGCELASEISQHRFPGSYPKKQVTLLDSHSNIVRRSDHRQQNMALKYLQDLGVEVICNEKVLDFDNAYLGSSGRHYSGYDKVFIATGTRPNSSLFSSCSSSDVSLENCIDCWGHIKVRPTLQIDHYKYNHIFAGGDVTNVVEEKTGYSATISGVCIARNICRLVKGKAPLKQGSKGTLPAPNKPLHGILEHGGIGKQDLNSVKKRFSFLNPSWAALKYFNEQQFLKIVQGQGSIGLSHVFGKLPRKLGLSPEGHNNSNQPLLPLQHSHFAEPYSPSVTSKRESLIMADHPLSNTKPNLSQNQGYSNNKHSAYNILGLTELPVNYNSTLSNNQGDIPATASASDAKVPLDMSFEHFTYGDEDIKLLSDTRIKSASSFSSPASPCFYNEAPSLSIATSPDIINTSEARATDPLMSYDKNFQLSPPPPRRTGGRISASTTASMDVLSLYSINSSNEHSIASTKLSRTSSLSSIV